MKVSPYGSEEALDTSDHLKISMSAEKGFRLKAPFISNRKYF